MPDTSKLILWFFLCLILCGCSRETPQPKNQPYYQGLPLAVLEKGEHNLLYTVNFEDPEKGILRVEVDYPARNKTVTFRGGNKGELDVLHIEFRNESGELMPYNTNKKNNQFSTQKKINGHVQVIYRMKIGGLGRHGHQGYFDKRFASFDGRIYLIPRERDHIHHIQVKFNEFPGNPDYKIITPWQPTSDPRTFQVFNYQNRKYLFKSLQKSLGAVGPFTPKTLTIGRTNVEIYTYAPWEIDFRKELEENSIKLFTYFNDKFDYNVEGPYQIVWTPNSSQNRRIWGAVWSNGMCYEMVPGRKSALRRNWELFGHRIAHPINEYEPYGIRHFAEKDEEFFLEGWASYIELVAVGETKIFEPDYRWERMYRRYLKMIMKGHDRPLSEEHRITDKDVKEFIHYTKSPLIVKLLAQEVFEKSGGQKTLEDFMGYLYPKYRGSKKKVFLKKELKEFTGHDFEPFWQKYVRSKRVIPKTGPDSGE